MRNNMQQKAKLELTEQMKESIRIGYYILKIPIRFEYPAYTNLINKWEERKQQEAGKIINIQ